jgi:hypothetical protein
MCGENASSNACVPVVGSNDFMTPTATPKKHVRPLQSSLPIFYAQPLPILTLTPIYPIPSKNQARRAPPVSRAEGEERVRLATRRGVEQWGGGSLAGFA